MSKTKILIYRNDQLNEEIELLRGRIELIKEERDCKAQDVRKFEHMYVFVYVCTYVIVHCIIILITITP